MLGTLIVGFVAAIFVIVLVWRLLHDKWRADDTSCLWIPANDGSILPTGDNHRSVCAVAG